jgi:hypothetical protein
LTGVSGHAMEAVVDPFGDREELGVTAHHDPSSVHPGIARVPEKDLQHLGHSAARSCGVHVPDRLAGKAAAGGVSDSLELSVTLFSDDRRQRGQRPYGDLDLVDPEAACGWVRWIQGQILPGSGSERTWPGV